MMIDPKTKTLWLLEKLKREHRLELDEYEYLIKEKTLEMIYYAGDLASDLREQYYGREVSVQGLIEIGNSGRNDCLGCGIRRTNREHEWYTLTKEQILFCCEQGYMLGLRTFVLKSGDQMLSVDAFCDIISEIRRRYPDCAVSLSLGVYTCEEYEQMYRVGADWYFLYLETADRGRYEKQHPKEMSLDNRTHCLRDLKKIGFQIGCGFMVDSPYQTPQSMAKVLKFVEEFGPDMCVVGPFIPKKNTSCEAFPHETLLQTVYMIALIRLIRPNIMLPVTVELGSLAEDGRERGIKAGANAVMMNLSSISVREKYNLYDKKTDKDDIEESLNRLKSSLMHIGYEVVSDRGDIRK